MYFSQVVAPPSACSVSIELNSARLRFDRLPDVHWLSTLIHTQGDDSAYSGEDDRQFRGNVTDGFNLLHWKLKRNVSGHDQSTFSVFC